MSNIIPPDETPRKFCPKCKELLPATLELFGKDKHSKDGLYSICRLCRADREKSRSPKLPIPGAVRSCKVCKQLFPLTADFFRPDKRSKDGFLPPCRSCIREKEKEYISRPEVQTRKKTYHKEYNNRSYVKEKKRAYNRDYISRPEVQEQRAAYQKEYNSRPEVQEHRNQPEERERHREADRKRYKRLEVREQRRAYMKERYSHPEVREYYRTYMKERYKRPEVQAHEREYSRNYRRRPGVREHKQAYEKAYMSRPEIILRQQEYRKKYRSRPEYHERHKMYKQMPEVRKRDSINKRVRRKRKTGAKGKLTHTQVQYKLRKQHYACYYCFKKFEKRKGQYVYHLEHTIPLSRTEHNPRHDVNYVVLACPRCNLEKHNKLPIEWEGSGRLF